MEFGAVRFLFCCQFALKMDDCLHRGDSFHLVSVIHYEGLTSTTLTRLDQLVTKVTGLCGIWIVVIYSFAGSVWIWCVVVYICRIYVDLVSVES